MYLLDTNVVSELRRSRPHPAVARIHGLTVVTRNVRDFEQFGVEILDPFAGPAS